MNFHSVRRRAERLLVECGEEDSIPINLEKIARILGLDLIKTDLADDVSGLLIADGEHTRICVRKQDALVRQRFTIAHEIGHHELAHQFGDNEHVHVDRGHVIRMRSPRSSTGEDRMEIEANQFAASLLMPEKAVRSVVMRAGHAPVSDTVVTDLARAFKVSEQAMTIRLTVLGLL
ncbi:MAG TPA: ImmA/IrrE family metallo-endopeptidase [Polyangiaceae bacterium]|jgi:Zn-dependent peptidase ImmA (M78 family)|nr:ImmA/IrrE family metallo-endopeptidase [Polyangiaceae bacterium]